MVTNEFNKANIKQEQKIQEDEYSYPYHYIPEVTPEAFSQNVYWSWGFRYLGGMHVVQNLCGTEKIDSLLDIGCGDGRFIREVSKSSFEGRLVGIDYSERAIGLAKAMNPNMDYRAVDILSDDFDVIEKFSVVTLVEVIEHIPPEKLNKFIEKAVSCLKPGGRLILTVPHKNKVLQPKHFQHFTSDMLDELLSPHLERLAFQPFDFPSKILSLWYKLLGNTGKYYLVTWKPLLKLFYDYYLKKCLYGSNENTCARIACVGYKSK